MTKTELAQNNSALCKALVSLRQPDVKPDAGKFCVTVKKDLAFCNGRIISLDENFRNCVVNGYDKAVMDAPPSGRKAGFTGDSECCGWGSGKTARHYPGQNSTPGQK